MVAMLRDCIYGQAVGDALGVPYEFMPRDTFECIGMVGYGTHNQPPGTWSDDTSMALAICNSYRELGRIDVVDIREKFLAWYRDGAYSCDGLFDIGNATATALRLGHGLSGERDNGNGSLMRTVPLAFTDATDDEVRIVSAITHAHATSTEACVKMVGAARSLISGKQAREVALAYGVDPDKPRGAIRSSGAIATACFLPSTLATIPTRRVPSLVRSPAYSTGWTEYPPNGLKSSGARTSSRGAYSKIDPARCDLREGDMPEIGHSSSSRGSNAGSRGRRLGCRYSVTWPYARMSFAVTCRRARTSPPRGRSLMKTARFLAGWGVRSFVRSSDCCFAARQ